MVGGMNLRHAAALALIGWYLMMPPEKQPSWLSETYNWLVGGHLVKEYDSEAPL